MKLLPVILVFTVIYWSCGSSRKTAGYSDIIVSVPETTAPPKPDNITFDAAATALKKKYGTYLKTSPDSITNLRLYSFIDHWLHTPYLWGGTDERGIDCSAFIQRLLSQVYNIAIPRTSVQQFFTQNIEPFGGKHYLHEGDLVFFRTMEGRVISHVGLYLGNNMFVNSSSPGGVSIADLGSPYWKKRFVAAGRVKTGKSSKSNLQGGKKH